MEKASSFFFFFLAFCLECGCNDLSTSSHFRPWSYLEDGKQKRGTQTSDDTAEPL